MSDFWKKAVAAIGGAVAGPIGAAVIGGLAANTASKRADSTAKDAAARTDQFEQEKFAEAKRQADILRQRGDEAAAAAIEEATRAEIGAEKFESLSNEYARRILETSGQQAQQFQNYATQADKAAALAEQRAGNIYKNTQDQSAKREQYGLNIYGRTKDAALAKEQAGQTAQQDVMRAAKGVTDAAVGNEERMNEARDTGIGYMDKSFEDISGRLSPFIYSERDARGQLDVEMGLRPGEGRKTYRDSPAYAAAMDASRVAEEDARGVIDQSAGNSGTLYSGTRGAALIDRAKRGSYERAGVEQSYFQNYMNMLQSMANPQATTTLSTFDASNANNKASIGMDTANNVGSAYMDAAGTGVNSQLAASQLGLNTMRTGMEGAELLNQLPTGMEGSELLSYSDPGNAGARDAALAASIASGGETTAANLSLAGTNTGTAGTDLRMAGQDYLTSANNNAAGVITGNMPTGVTGANYRMAGTEAKNAALADTVGAGANIYSAYLMGAGNRPVMGPATPETITTRPTQLPAGTQSPVILPYTPYMR